MMHRVRKSICDSPLKCLSTSNRYGKFRCICHEISSRTKINSVRRSPAVLRTAIENILAKSLREQQRETYTLKHLVNMEQTPLIFVMMTIQCMKKPPLMKFRQLVINQALKSDFTAHIATLYSVLKKVCK